MGHPPEKAIVAFALDPRIAAVRMIGHEMRPGFPAAFLVALTAADAVPQMRLYVTNSLGDDITVIDLATMKTVQTFKVGTAVHGILRGRYAHVLRHH